MRFGKRCFAYYDGTVRHKDSGGAGAARIAHYVVYDDKLAVFSYEADFADTFSDIYTLEALALRLKGAEEADIINAFITLPNLFQTARRIRFIIRSRT